MLLFERVEVVEVDEAALVIDGVLELLVVLHLLLEPALEPEPEDGGDNDADADGYAYCAADGCLCVTHDKIAGGYGGKTLVFGKLSEKLVQYGIYNISERTYQ